MAAEGFVVGAPVVALGLQLVGDEPDRHDLDLLGGVEEPLARTVAGGGGPESNLVEPTSGVAAMAGARDRGPPATVGVDVGEGAVGKPRSFCRTELGHAANHKPSAAHP